MQVGGGKRRGGVSLLAGGEEEKKKEDPRIIGGRTNTKEGGGNHFCEKELAICIGGKVNHKRKEGTEASRLPQKGGVKTGIDSTHPIKNSGKKHEKEEGGLSNNFIRGEEERPIRITSKKGKKKGDGQVLKRERKISLMILSCAA